MRVAEIRACRLCEANLPLGPRPILQFHRDAKILIAGQAPGRRAHESGIPFDDASGNRLREWLGVSTSTFYERRKIAIVPMGFCYPGSSRSGDLPPRPECAATWRARLLGDLRKVELTLVIGRYAVDWHIPNSGSQSMTDIVAQWERFWPKMLVMPHPSPRNQRWLRDNPGFSEHLLPRLKERVAALIG